MTVREIASAMLRRWYIPVVVLLCASLLTVWFVRDGGVYTTKTVVAFLLPSKTSLSPSNGTDDASVIAFAGTVAQEINNGRPADLYSTDEAPFYGAGVREGVLVTLPNAGNQWVSSFLRAEIEIQIVGRTEEWVHAQQQTLLGEIMAIVAGQQESLTDPAEQIQASVVPLTTKIEHVSPNRGAQVGAVIAMITAALIVAGWGSVAFDRTFMRRRRSDNFAVPQRPPSIRLKESTP